MLGGVGRWSSVDSLAPSYSHNLFTKRGISVGESRAARRRRIESERPGRDVTRHHISPKHRIGPPADPKAITLALVDPAGECSHYPERVDSKCLDSWRRTHPGWGARELTSSPVLHLPSSLLLDLPAATVDSHSPSTGARPRRPPGSEVIMVSTEHGVLKRPTPGRGRSRPRRGGRDGTSPDRGTVD